MPSTMIHLLCAADYAPEMDPVFCVGCIAPDCIDVREFKDHTHFRDIPTAARPAALRDFARGLTFPTRFCSEPCSIFLPITHGMSDLRKCTGIHIREKIGFTITGVR